MSNVEGFELGASLREAIEVFNKIPIDKFPLVLSRVCENLHEKDFQFFTTVEKEQLCNRFGFTTAELQLALDGCSYLFEQAAYSSIAPDVLSEALKSTGCEEAHANAAGRVWALEGAGFVARVKSTRTLGTRRLVQSEFRLNLVMAQGGHGEGLLGPRKLNEPTALIELTLAGGEGFGSGSVGGSSSHVRAHAGTTSSSASSRTAAAASSSSSSSSSDAVDRNKVGIEMSHEELYAFFRQLERIQQEHLDKLI